MALVGFPEYGGSTGLKAVLGAAWASHNNMTLGTILVLQRADNNSDSAYFTEDGTTTGDVQSNRLRVYFSGSSNTIYRSFYAITTGASSHWLGYGYGNGVTSPDYSFGELQAWTTAEYGGNSWGGWSPHLDSSSIDPTTMLSALTIAPLNTFQVTQGGNIIPNGEQYWGYDHPTSMYSGDADITFTFAVENLGEGVLAVDSVTLGDNGKGNFALDGTNAVTTGTLIGAASSANLVIKWTNDDAADLHQDRVLITVSTSAGDYVFPVQINYFGTHTGGTKALKAVLTGAAWNDNPHSQSDIIYLQPCHYDSSYHYWSENGEYDDPGPTNRMQIYWGFSYPGTGSSCSKVMSINLLSTGSAGFAVANWNCWGVGSAHPNAPTTWTSAVFADWLTMITSAQSAWSSSYLSSWNTFFTTSAPAVINQPLDVFTVTKVSDPGTLQITQEGRVLSDAVGSYHIGTRVSADVAIATKRTWTFTIENTDVTDGLTISGIVPPAGFTVDYDTAFLGPGATLDVTVEIAPGDPASLSGDIHIFSSDNADFTIPITGVRMIQPTSLQVGA